MNFAAPGLRADAKWLLAIVSVGSAAGRIERLRALDVRALDATRLHALAMRHRVESQVARALESLPCDPSEIAPAGLLPAIRAAARAECIHSLRLTRELLEVVALLEQNSIPVLAYKGPVLAAALYGAAAARHSWDLDVLVRRADLERARGLLHERGYVPEPQPPSQAERDLLALDCECNLDHPRLGVHLELHWDLFDEENRRGLDAEFLWKNATRVEFAGSTVLAPSPAAMFIVACAHGGEKHRWGRLKWVLDIARFPAAYPALDWPAALALAESVGRRQAVLEGIYLATHLLGAEFPPALAAAAERDEWVAANAAHTRGRLFRDDADFPGFGEWRAYLHAARAEAEADAGKNAGLREKLRTLALYLRTVFTPDWADRRRHRVPRRLGFLRYLLRARELAHTYRADLTARLK
ncbi:MAG: nucleotidyltransferase family protein [Planctomycetes bacterium]|nr:nucleotidyltransferase family protein [Planctomycetota bacterium]